MLSATAADRRLALAVALGGTAGTTLRLATVSIVESPSGTWPVATFVVNMIGTLLLATLVGYNVQPETRALLGTGLSGALTTFSTMQLELVSLARTSPPRAATYLIASVGLGLVLARVGISRGRAWQR